MYLLYVDIGQYSWFRDLTTYLGSFVSFQFLSIFGQSDLFSVLSVPYFDNGVANHCHLFLLLFLVQFSWLRDKNPHLKVLAFISYVLIFQKKPLLRCDPSQYGLCHFSCCVAVGYIGFISCVFRLLVLDCLYYFWYLVSY